MPSPPPPYNFVVIPVVHSRHPLWEDRLQEGSERSSIGRGMLLNHGRETLATTALDAEPDAILKMPGDSYAPVLLALALAALFSGAIVHWWWLTVVGAVVVLLATLGWLWPEPALGQTATVGHE